MKLNKEAKETLSKVQKVREQITYILDNDMVWSQEGDELDKLSDMLYETLSQANDEIEEVVREIWTAEDED